MEFKLRILKENERVEIPEISPIVDEDNEIVDEDEK